MRPSVKSKDPSANRHGEETKRVHVALPIRVSYRESSGNSIVLETACTYDIHPRGARLWGSRNFNVGETLTVERGRSKTLCKVVWAGDADSELRGQFSVESLEDEKTMWEEELRKCSELYDSISTDARPLRRQTPRKHMDKRRGPRFVLHGDAGLVQMATDSWVDANLKEISEFGCLVASKRTLSPGMELKLVLNTGYCDLTLKGLVKHTGRHPGVGIEFREIRRGDGPLLRYLLQNLSEKVAVPEEMPKAELVDLPF
jgi:hypothetical protein